MCQTINLLRALSSGGYADIHKLHAWNMDFVGTTAEGSKYREMASKIEDTLRFMKVIVLLSSYRVVETVRCMSGGTQMCTTVNIMFTRY